jgi:hypothetical protein
MNVSTLRKTAVLLFLLTTGVLLPAQAQKFVWRAGVHSFFDNNEFSGSKVKESQTMAGVHLVPQVGISWNDKHRIFAGVDVMQEFGSNKIPDFYDPIVYYEYAGNPFRFYMGAFPREYVLKDYPKMFFQDSILNYRPLMTGIFWEYRKNESYLNAWLDWTSRQTYDRHEAFFMGWSGRYNLGLFYGQHFGYMFHFAGIMDPEEPEGLHDNGLILTSLGIDLSSKTSFARLEANVGWSVGFDRDRNIGVWHRPQGFLSEIKVEYKGLGVFNTYYRGGSQQFFYEDHGNELYWGDPIYRAKEFNRTDIYVYFMKTDVVKLKLIYSLHFTEQTMYHQQAFYATFDLDNFNKKDTEKYEYIWSNWF